MINLEPLPMKEAQQFWKDKVKLSPAEFAKLPAEAKIRAFAVSGIAKGDELTTVFNALQKSLDKGTTFEDFKKDCAEVFERRGWTGEKAFRLDNIFRTNIQTAYGVGRYKQMMEVKDSRPYWQYSAVNDSRTRPAHRALNGKIFRYDHPFWDTWYPPKGYRCRCGVITLSAREIERDGQTISTEDPTGKLFEPIDPKTGNKMPARLLMPDPGFANNPGKTVWGGIVDASDKPGKWEALPNLKNARAYGREPLKDISAAEIPLLANELLPAGKTDEYYKQEFIRRYGNEKLVKDVLGEPVILSLRAFVADKTPGAREVWKFDKAGHGESIPLMEDIVLKPLEVWLTPQKNERGQIRLAKRYIGFWKTADMERLGGLGVYEVVDGVFQGVTAFLPKNRKGAIDPGYIERQRQGLLLYKK